MATDPIHVLLPPLLTVQDIRRICRIGERQAYELAHAVGPVKLGRSLRWDAEAGKVAGDDEANGRLARAYRAPWKHPTPESV